MVCKEYKDKRIAQLIVKLLAAILPSTDPFKRGYVLLLQKDEQEAKRLLEPRLGRLRDLHERAMPNWHKYFGHNIKDWKRFRTELALAESLNFYFSLVIDKKPIPVLRDKFGQCDPKKLSTGVDITLPIRQWLRGKNNIQIKGRC